MRQKEIPGKKKDHDEKIGIPFRKVAEIYLIGPLPMPRNGIRWYICYLREKMKELYKSQ